MNDAPETIGELTSYFAALPANQLSGCWVACVVDALDRHGADTSELARCLTVVAERLHGAVVPGVEMAVSDRVMRGVLAKQRATTPRPPAPFPPAAGENTQRVPGKRGSRAGKPKSQLRIDIENLAPGERIRVPITQKSYDTISAMLTQAKRATGRRDLHTKAEANATVVFADAPPTTKGTFDV